MLAAIPFPPLSPNIIEFGPLVVKWYGLAYVGGLLFAAWYMKRLVTTPNLWGNRKPTMAAGQIDDMFIWFFLGVVLGGRLGYVFLYQPLKYLASPLEILAVWDGGMSFHGGFLGVVVACYFYGRKIGASLDKMLDLGAASTAVGLGLGRLANFINAELYGNFTSLPWGVVFPGDTAARHPSQIYEFLLEGVLIFILVRIATHRYLALSRPGLASAIYAFTYGASRIFIEFFREPDAHLGYYFGFITQGMIYSLPLLGVGIWLWMRSRRS